MRRPFDDATWLQLSDRNLAEAVREHARMGSPHTIEEQSGLLLTASCTSFPAAFFNGAMGQGDEALAPNRLWAEAARFFARHQRGFGIQVRAHRDEGLLADCRARSLYQAGDSPGMLLTERPGAPTLAPGVQITQAGAAHAEAFVALQAEAYESLGLPPEVTRAVFHEAENWLTSPHWRGLVLMQDDRPCAAAMLLLSHGIGGVYWVGTAPDARGRGHGEAVTRAICQLAFDHGAAGVVLQASTQGEPIYRRIGFREITRYPWFIVPQDQVEADPS